MTALCSSIISIYTINVHEFSMRLVYCLVHLKYYMHLFKNCNSIEVGILEHMVQGTLQS